MAKVHLLGTKYVSDDSYVVEMTAIEMSDRALINDKPFNFFFLLIRLLEI